MHCDKREVKQQQPRIETNRKQRKEEKETKDKDKRKQDIKKSRSKGITYVGNGKNTSDMDGEGEK